MNNPKRVVYFDQVKYIHKLEAVGVTRAQAEVQAQTFNDFINDHLATKQDLEQTEMVLRNEILKSEAVLRADMQILKRDLKIWFGGMMATFVVVMSAIVGIIVHVK